VDLWGEWASELIDKFARTKALPSYRDDKEYLDLTIAKEWGMTIENWDTLSEPQKKIYRKYEKLRRRKESFDAAMRWWTDPKK
jgi:hypothetical protein